MSAPSNDRYREAYVRGVEAFENDDMERALIAFQDALAAKPDDPCTLEMLACTLGSLERYAESARTFEQLDRAGHVCTNCLINSSIAYRQLGDHEAARRALQRCIELQPDNAHAWFRLGLSLEALAGDGITKFRGSLAEQAWNAFERTVAVDAQYDEAWPAQARVLYRLWQNANDVRQMMGYEGLSTRYLRELQAALDRTAEAMPWDAYSWYIRGLVARELDALDRATEWITRSVDLNPDFAEGWFELARTRRQGGDQAGSSEALQRAFELDPDLKNRAESEFGGRSSDGG